MKLSINTYLTILGVKFTIKKKNMKNKRWYIAFSHKGKRINRSTGLEATKSNLRIVKSEVLPQIAQELIASMHSMSNNVLPENDLFENFAEDHFNLLEKQMRSHVFKRTIGNYVLHILPYFKGRKLSSLNPMELESWQNRLLSQYKPLSVQKYRSILYGIFTRAVQNELIIKNPLDTVTAPTVSKAFTHISDKQTVNPFTQTELDLITTLKDDDTYMPNFIQLMANTGMRPGEIIALTWKDINFDNRTININKTIVNNVCGLPKTPSSVRVIDMIEGAYKALQEQYKLTSDVEYVFTNSSRKRFYSHDIINLNFRRRLLENNIDVRPLYQLRHSFASRLIRSGIDITWVSAMLGHKDSSITLQIYTKFIQEDQQTRLANLDKINEKLKKEKQ